MLFRCLWLILGLIQLSLCYARSTLDSINKSIIITLANKDNLHYQDEIPPENGLAMSNPYLLQKFNLFEETTTSKANS